MPGINLKSKSTTSMRIQALLKMHLENQVWKAKVD